MALQRRPIRKIQALFNSLADPKRKVNDAYIIKVAVRIEQILLANKIDPTKAVFEVRSKRTEPFAVFDIRDTALGINILAEIEVPAKSQLATRFAVLGHALRACQITLTKHIAEVNWSVKHMGKNKAKRAFLSDLTNSVKTLREQITY